MKFPSQFGLGSGWRWAGAYGRWIRGERGYSGAGLQLAVGEGLDLRGLLYTNLAPKAGRVPLVLEAEMNPG